MDITKVLALLVQFKSDLSDALSRGAKTIADLQAQIASGVPVTSQQLQSVFDGLTDADNSVKAFDVPVAPPAA